MKAIYAVFLTVILYSCTPNKVTDDSGSQLKKHIDSVSQVFNEIAWRQVNEKPIRSSQPLDFQKEKVFCNVDGLREYSLRNDPVNGVFITMYLPCNNYPSTSVNARLLKDNVIATFEQGRWQQHYRYENNKLYVISLDNSEEEFSECLNTDSIVKVHTQMYQEAWNNFKGQYRVSEYLPVGTMYFVDDDQVWRYELQVRSGCESFDHMISIKKFPSKSNSEFLDTTQVVETIVGVILQVTNHVIAIKNPVGEWVQVYRYDDGVFYAPGPEGVELSFKEYKIQ